MDKHGRRLTDIRTKVVNGELVRIMTFSDGTTDEKIVSDERVNKLLEAVRRTPDIELVYSKKEQKAHAGHVTGEGLSLLFLGIVLVTLAALFSGCFPEEDGRCTGPNWHKFDDCY